jgi:hyperosmotically inducible periplasmic protein
MIDASFVRKIKRPPVIMKTKSLIVAVLGSMLAVASLVWAQSAGQSMHEAGQATESSAKNAGHAIVDVYHGAKTATVDTTVTAKVKTALDEDAVTKHQHIHVTTVAGVVTLRGKVSSEDVAAHAVHLTERTKGVKSVRNRLEVSAAS